MAAPPPGFTPLLLSSLALHLLLLGPLFALTPGTVSAGAASHPWSGDAGKVRRQQQKHPEPQQRWCVEARESPRGSWNVCPSRWTAQRIQTGGCWGTLGGYFRNGTRRGTQEVRLRGVGTLWRYEAGTSPPLPPLPLPPPPPPPHHRGSGSSRSRFDGVGAGEGWRLRRKGVVPPTVAPAFASLPVHNGKKRALQRTRACAQLWPASRPHLAKRGAAGAFVSASGLCGAPGSEDGRRGEEVRERGGGARTLPAADRSPDKSALNPAINFSPETSDRKPPKSTFPRLSPSTNNLDASDLECMCRLSTYDAFPTRSTRTSHHRGEAGGVGEVSLLARRRACNCSHLARHNVIDPGRVRVGGDDSCLTSQCRKTDEKEAGRCGIKPGVVPHLVCCAPPALDAHAKYHYRAIVAVKGRDGDEINEGSGVSGWGMCEGNKHINSSHYAGNYLALPILTSLCAVDNELLQGKPAPVTSSHAFGEGREVTGGGFALNAAGVGDGFSAGFMVPEGGVTQRDTPIQSTFSSIGEIASRNITHAGAALEKHTDTRAGENRAKSVAPPEPPPRFADEVSATPGSETRGDSGFFAPVKFAAVAPAASRHATAVPTRPGTVPRDETNLTARWDESARPLSASPRHQRVFLWRQFNTNSNNNNNAEEGTDEANAHDRGGEEGKSPWRDRAEHEGQWESAWRDVDQTRCAECAATGLGEHTHMQLKSGKQVPLEPGGVRQLDGRRQMGDRGERDAEREGEGFEGSAAAAAGGGKLQVGAGQKGARLNGGREPGLQEEEEEWQGERGITKEGEAKGEEGQERGITSSTLPDSKKGKKERRADESRVEVERNGEKEEVERHSSREQRSLERLIMLVDDETTQGQRERKILMPWPRSRRAANRHPYFSQHNYQVQVAENQPPGTSVIVMSASDPDPGDAGRVSYSFAPLMNSRSSDYFHIHPETGLITTTQILDREHMDLHYFRVTATDHGSSRLSGTTMVAITVSDRNDHSPIFEQAEYRETIRENVEEGYPILQLRATDLDSPSNANIRYRFIGDMVVIARAAFEIDPRSGLITTRGVVDRETNEHYTLLVEASDQGKEPGPRSATVKVFITVLDENDNVPQFSEKRYVVAVKEDVRPHSEILRISATDQDKDSNAAVHYNIISGNSRGQFSIDSVTGEIQVVAPLDFETEREYTLRVRAQDNGRPPLSNNTGIVSVQVTDVNDNPPIFVSTPFQATVLESAPVGSSILHIHAIDTDSADNARLEYRLTGTSSDTPFVINSATGWVTVSSALDRESVEHYFFGVEARDYGMPPLSATASVTITVMDVNDNRPEFLQKEYYARLNEDAAVGTSVVTVTAVDRDVNSAVTYQITGGNTRNRFAISTAGGGGLLSLALPLDYKQERRYVLTVTASDRTLHDTCQVYINITDANTHRPVFQSAHYSISVNENQPPGSTVVVISATDDDVGENARITYYLEDNIPQFRIDSGTGAITLQAELDYEDQMTYTLAITAKDNGIPQKSDTTYVEVNVNDVNDNAPQFLSPRYQGSVSEDAPPFTSVLQISATDRDAHANGRVQYTFQNGEDGDGDFTIEPTSGIVRTVRRLDRESVPFYELTAYAVDRGVPPQRTPVHIQVTVRDVNDNAPVFPADDFEVLVKENSAVGSVVAQITATDPDEGANAQIMYQIVEGNIPEIFQMDIFSGELTSLIDLDYESRNEYVIVVQATSAPLVSRATVRIKLVDQNDNEPTLQDFQIIFNNFVSNRSNSFPNGVIGRVPAHDPDVSDRLYYTIDTGNELHLLLLNHTSGEIRLSRKLDNNRPLVAAMGITVTGKTPWRDK